MPKLTVAILTVAILVRQATAPHERPGKRLNLSLFRDIIEDIACNGMCGLVALAAARHCTARVRRRRRTA